MVLTGGCLLVYILTFESFGISVEQIFRNNNRYFNGDVYNDDVIASLTGETLDSSQQSHILSVVQGGWFLMIVCGQATHIWLCRTTTVSVFTHGVFSNRVTNVGVLVAIGLGCLVVYTPGLQTVVHAQPPDSLLILYASLAVAAVLWTFTEGRKFITRNYPEFSINKYLAW